MPKGNLYVISGPSGAGKGTVMGVFLPQHPEMFYSVSATTRAPRPGEEDGVNYYFMGKEAFEKLRAENGFLESATFCGNHYGTPRKAVMDKLESGTDVILEIEVQGAMQVMESYPEGIFIFIAPPSMEELKNRLCGRGTETEEAIQTRLKRAEEEMALRDKYTYVVVNVTPEGAAEELDAIMKKENARKCGRN